MKLTLAHSVAGHTVPIFLSIQDNADNDMFGKELRVLLQSGMFLAGAIGFVLDNTIPGVLVKFI